MHYRTAQLRKELKCSSTGPIIWTTLTQIPLFVLGTTALQHAGYLPEVLAAAAKEMFLTLPGEETLLMPLIIGAASIANYGMGSWGLVQNMAKRGGVEVPNIKDEEGEKQEGPKFNKSVESQSMLTTFSILAVMRGVISMSLSGVSTQLASRLLYLIVFSMIDCPDILAHLNTAQYRRNIDPAVRGETKNASVGSQLAPPRYDRCSAQEGRYQPQKDAAIDKRSEESDRVRTRQDEGCGGRWTAGTGAMEDAGDGSTTWRSLAVSFEGGKGSHLEFQREAWITNPGEEAATTQNTYGQVLRFRQALRIPGGSQ